MSDETTDESHKPESPDHGLNTKKISLDLNLNADMASPAVSGASGSLTKPRRYIHVRRHSSPSSLQLRASKGASEGVDDTNLQLGMAISLFAAPKENKRQSGPLIGDGLSSRDENISSNSKPPPAWTDRQMYVLVTAYKMYPGETQIWVRVKKEHAALFATKTTGVMSKKYGSMKSLGIVDKILSGDYFGGRDLSRSDEEEHRIPILINVLYFQFLHSLVLSVHIIFLKLWVSLLFIFLKM